MVLGPCLAEKFFYALFKTLRRENLIKKINRWDWIDLGDF